MLPTHHLPQLILNRVNSATGRLAAEIWSSSRPLQVEATKAGPELLSIEAAGRLKRTVVSTPSSWGKLFDQRWCRIVVPAGTGRWLKWQDQGEATLYVEGKACFGFDVAHHWCRLPERVTEVWIESNCIQSGVWHPDAVGLTPQGSLFEGAFLCERNEEVWQGYHDLKCLFDLALDQRSRENPNLQRTLGGAGLQPPVDSYTPVYRRMLRMLDEAVDALDSSGVTAMRRKLAAVYKDLRVDKTFMQCTLTGHAHLDLVWIWPERMGELKAVHIFSTMDHLMEEYPEFKFGYSQPASYEAVERRAPELYKRVQKRLKQGRWQATGAMYVESDTLIACGEALARSFTVGQEEFRRIRGSESKLTWLPDVFGYSACLPQIMRQAGVDYFFTTKMTWNAINRFPHSSFIWRGNDGSEVVAHVTQDTSYVTHMQVETIRNAMNGHRQSDIHYEFLLPTGYGDGGGGPTHDMCERARRLGSLPGMPAMEWGNPEDFFERLGKLRDQLPVHQGECYLEYHRGTFTTHSDLKSTFRELERALQIAEAAKVITGKEWESTFAWKRSIFAQFHDYIPGSSVWDVYVEGLPELRKCAAAQLAEAGQALSSRKSAEACLLNPHALPVRKWISLSGSAAPAYVELPALSGSAVTAVKATELPQKVNLNGKTASNGLVTFRLDRNGWMDRLEWEGVAVPLRNGAGRLVRYSDRAAHFEAWDIDRHVLSLGEVCRETAEIESIDESYQGGFRIRRKIGEKSSVTVEYLLEAGSPLVHVSLDLDWQEPETLLKFLISTGYSATNARFGSPFGSVLRSQTPNGLSAEAMWEVPFSRYLAVFDEGERDGLFLVTEAKYGATVRNGEIGLSLVRSPRVTGMESHAHAWPGRHLSRLKNLSTCSDLGKQKVRFAIGRYSMDLARERQPAALADTLFTGPLPYHGAPLASPLLELSGGETLVPAWVKPAGKNGWILRLHEVAGRRGTVIVRAAEGWTLELTDLAESEGKSVERNTVPFSPYQIVSVRFRKT